MYETDQVFQLHVGKPNGKRLIEDFRHIWQKSLKIDLGESCGLDLRGSTQRQ